MRVLLSGGIKTDNILREVEKKFQSSGEEFLVVNYIDTVDDIYSKGDYFDKAIITEQSITKEYTINDEAAIRKRVNDFALDMQRRGKKVTYVFLLKSEEIANMVQEEILPIIRFSAVVVQQPPYAVTFMASLIITDVGQLPDKILYHPKSIVGDTSYNSNNSDTDLDLTSDMDLSDNYTVKNAPSDMSNLFGFNEEDNLFGDEEDDPFASLNEFDSFTPDENTSTSESESEEFNFEDGLFGDENNNMDQAEQTFENNENIDNQFGSNSSDGFNFEDENSLFINDPDAANSNSSDGFNFEDENSLFINDSQQFELNQEQFEVEQNQLEDEGIELENIEPLGQSYEDAPELVDKKVKISKDEEYTGDMNYEDDYGTMQENDLYANYDPNAPIEGFDDTVEDDSLYADTSMNYDNMVDDSDLYGNQGGMSYDDNSNMGNAEEELYNVDEDMNNGNNVGFDIDADLYGTPEQMDDAQSSVAEDPEANMYQMEEEKRARETQLRQQDMMMQQQMNNQGKKKGLLGRFKKGNAQPQQPMMVPNQLNVNAPVQNNVNPMGNIGNIGRVNATSVQTELKPFAARGNNIVVTGCGGCGTSTVAYNIANIINQLGYTVLLIDLDTEGRSQNYISRANYESMEPDGANLMAAVNSSTNFQSHVSVVKSGFHLLTMGLGTDVAPVNEMLQEDRIPRFLNMAKSASNFVIYDVPFNSAKGYLKDVVYRADNLVLVTDASNWGVTKTMLSVCNIEENDMQDIMFTKAQLVFNRYRNLSKVLGKKVRTCSDIAKVMDQKVIELLGEDPGFHFSDLHIAGIINDDPDFENGWFDDIQYSDTKRGQEVFLRLAESIVLKK